MTSYNVEDPLPRSPSPDLSLSQAALSIARVRSPDKAATDRPADRTSRLVPDLSLPFRRSNPSLSALFASTSGSAPATRASSFTGTGTPPIPQIGQSVFSPGPHERALTQSTTYRDLILRSFVPHVAVYPSQDVEDLTAQKGFTGGFLELIRPYGETVQGKVTIRDSTGSSRSWEDFGVRFTKLKDGLEGPRLPERKSTDIRPQNVDGLVDQYFPASSARLRTGGDIQYIEDAVSKHLSYSESQSSPGLEDYLTHNMTANSTSPHTSDFHLLYLRRLLSGLPLSSHETFSHPVACVIAVSSRHPDPIEELRQLQANTVTGDQRLPQWVNPEYLRYYVLVHDEDHDDVQRSTTLFDQMKRHFGLNCHLLRLRSEQCIPSDDDVVRLPVCEWCSAAEELTEIQKQESFDYVEDPGPYLYNSDAASIRTFIREFVTQALVPLMERLCAQWNDQIASRRRGLTGRFNSIAKKWSPFGTSRSTTSPLSTNAANPNSNFDQTSNSYSYSTPESLMRKLADYAFMLRDFRLANSTYELLRTDFSNDKAWKHYAGASEMLAVTMLIQPQGLSSKARTETVDQLLEAASYSYLARSVAPYYALRTLAVATELLLLRGGSSADDAARWACRITELELTGPLGHALFAERVAAAYGSRKGTGSQAWGARRRKSALWSIFATEAWLRLDRPRQAEKNLKEVLRVYDVGEKGSVEGVNGFVGMRIMLEDLKDTVAMKKGEDGPATHSFPDFEEALAGRMGAMDIEEVGGGDAEKLDSRPQRGSVTGIGRSGATDPLGVGPMPVERLIEDDAQEEVLQ